MNLDPVNEIVLDVELYLILSGIFQAAVQVIAFLVLLPVIIRKGSSFYFRLIFVIAIFNVALLVWGSFGNALWAAIARDKYYVAGDPVVEWFAYFPFGRWAYDYTEFNVRGQLINGATITQLRLLWFGIAAPVWALSYVTVKTIFRLTKPIQAV